MVFRLWTSGLAIGGGLCLVYGFTVNGTVSVGQAFQAWYFATALLIGIECVNRFLITALATLFHAKPPAFHPWRQFGANLTRLLLLVSAVLPFVMAAVMVYRPKVNDRSAVDTLATRQYETAQFASRDGTPLVGWWIRSDQGDSTETVVLFHGLGAGKANFLSTALPLLRAGYNVFVFDFRAHGGSGGQLTSFGDLERYDAAAAIDWVREKKPEQSKAVFGLGASMGAAALVAAVSSDDLSRGKLTAIAVLGTYDSFPAVADAVASHDMPWPLGPLTRWIGLPLASVHVGRDLNAFRPAEMIAQVWPTPVLIVHGSSDEIIPFSCGERLFEAAVIPKRHLWVPLASHNAVLDDPSVISNVIQFFKTARPVPVI